MKQRKNNVRGLIPYIVSFLAVAGIVALTVTETGQTEKKDSISLYGEQESIMIISNNSTGELYNMDISGKMQETEAESAQEGYEEIEALIMRYFRAVTRCSIETLNSIVESSEGISEEKLQEKAKYIQYYNNIVCYIEEGLAEDTYIVYVSYEAKFKQISTMAPNLERFYVERNSDGEVYIYRGDVDGESAAYMQEVEKRQKIIQLTENINQRFLEACRQEKRLVELRDILQDDFWNHS